VTLRTRITLAVAALLAAALVVVVAFVAVGGAGSSPARAGSTPAATTIDVGTDRCANDWTSSTGGTQRFAVHNTSSGGIEVYLEDPSTGAVYLDVESLGGTATQTVSLRLADGTYRFECLPDDADPVLGATVTITAAADVRHATPGIVPITANDLTPAVLTYEKSTEQRLPVLLRQVRRLNRDVRQGRSRAARRDWLTAHLTYETLGAAYGAFGDFDAAINGMAASGRTALNDPDLEGFHKIEALLWTKARPSRVEPYTAKLVRSVTHLSADFADAQIDPLDIGLRSHEILENAIQFELTGATDAGSHSNLATIDANLTGTLRSLAPIRSLLTTRYAQLSATYRWIARSQELVRSYHLNGSWTPLSKLTSRQRAQLDATLGQTVELLAPIAAMTDPRKASAR
jgi:iron uptake system component EfeO